MSVPGGGGSEEAAQCRQAWLTGGDICPLCDRSQFWSLADSLLRDLAQKTHHRKVPRKWKCKGHQIRANVPEYFDNEKPYFSVSSIYVLLLCSIFLQRDPFFSKKNAKPKNLRPQKMGLHLPELTPLTNILSAVNQYTPTRCSRTRLQNDRRAPKNHL